ncbi:hypothetical protein FOL47_008559 [Perkinsus chesapeaki]|uniref:Uncharacterized protein n=1 Tax=Perkinsus chesapeaki TaxID=330153 RepID=A0A7J6LDM3_PERCH|nr:hypothetical protein FOL47_008559 [Perkinsus chesapeaki]
MRVHIGCLSLLGALESVGAEVAAPSNVVDKKACKVTQTNANNRWRFTKRRTQSCRLECANEDYALEFEKDEKGFHIRSVRHSTEVRSTGLDTVTDRLPSNIQKKKSANCEEATQQLFHGLYQGDPEFGSEVDKAANPMSASLLVEYLFKLGENEGKILPLEGLDVTRMFSKSEPERLRCRASVIGDPSTAFTFTLSRSWSVFTIETVDCGKAKSLDLATSPQQVELSSNEAGELSRHFQKDTNRCISALNSLFRKMITSAVVALITDGDLDKSHQDTGHVLIDYMCKNFVGALESVGAAVATHLAVPQLDHHTFSATDSTKKGGVFSKSKRSRKKDKICRVETKDKNHAIEFEIIVEKITCNYPAGTAGLTCPDDELPAKKIHLTSVRYGKVTSREIEGNPLPDIETCIPNPSCDYGTTRLFGELYKADELFRASVDDSAKPVSIMVLIRHLLHMVTMSPPSLMGLEVEDITTTSEPEKLRCRATTTGHPNTLEVSLSRDKSTFTVDGVQVGEQRTGSDDRAVQFEFDVRSVMELKENIQKGRRKNCVHAIEALYSAVFNSREDNLKEKIIDEEGEKNTGTIFIEYLFNKKRGKRE